MALPEYLEPYLTNPMWISIGLSLIILMIFPFLLKFIRPDLWNNFFHIPYWHAYILDGKTVMRKVIQRKDLKSLRIKSIEIKPYTWIIRENSWIDDKSASIIFLDIKSCVSISVMTDEQKELFSAIQREKNPEKLLAKIPIVKRFVESRKQLFDSHEKLAGFARKVRANPEFIINAITLHIFLKQKFTNDIIKVPKTLWEILEENMSLLIIASGICIVLFLVLNKAPNL